jgi:hypothetical protein
VSSAEVEAERLLAAVDFRLLVELGNRGHA